MDTQVNIRDAVNGTGDSATVLAAAARVDLQHRLQAHEHYDDSEMVYIPRPSGKPIPREAIHYLKLLMTNVHYTLLFEWLRAVSEAGYEPQPEVIAMLIEHVYVLEETRTSYFAPIYEVIGEYGRQLIHKMGELDPEYKALSLMLFGDDASEQSVRQSEKDKEQEQREKMAEWLEKVRAKDVTPHVSRYSFLIHDLSQIEIPWTTELTDVFLTRFIFDVGDTYALRQLPKFAHYFSLDVDESAFDGLRELVISENPTVRLKNVPSHRKRIMEAKYVLALRHRMLAAIRGEA